MPDLSIVIVNWNSKDFLRKCLKSLETSAPANAFPVIVADGASFDGCGEMLASEYPQADFIQLTENRGFAHANNAAFAHVRTPYVLFLNPDTEVRPNAIDALLRFHQDTPGSGICGAKLLNTDGTIQTSCVQAFATPLNQALNCDFLRRLFPRSQLWGNAAVLGSSPASVAGISGACMLMKSSLFKELGGFNTDYFMYSEDMELSWRSIQAGYANYYVPHAEIIHHGGGSSQGEFSRFSAVEMVKSAHHFICRRCGPAQGALFRCAIAVSALLRIPFLALGASCSTAPKRKCHLNSMKRWATKLAWCAFPHDCLRCRPGALPPTAEGAKGTPA